MSDDSQENGAYYPEGPEQHQRGHGESAIVYPVISRRSHGLSLGINLFPDRKVCTYHCPYCEVPAFSNPAALLRQGMVDSALRRFFMEDWPALGNSFELKDICLSGNGEPTCSPFFKESIHTLARLRQEKAVPLVPIVLITNSTGFLNREMVTFIQNAAPMVDLEVWAKLDGGTPALHSICSGSSYAYKAIVEGIARFSRSWPVIIQTMIFVDSRSDTLLFDPEAYVESVEHIRSEGGQISALQLYTLARAPYESWPRALGDNELAAIAGEVAGLLSGGIRIECYGSRGEIDVVPSSGRIIDGNR